MSFISLPHFVLPRLPPKLYLHLDPQDTSQLPQPIINESLCFYLNDIKQHIHTHEHMWETFKKFTNTYEYIHTTIPYKKYCISRYRPLSRSFFKMIELINFFDLGMDATNSIRTFHLAEGPGGFIEAVAKYRGRPDDQYVGMTLLDKNNNDYNIPAWKKSQHFLQETKNVKIESGCDKTGNILSLDNFVYIHELYGSSMDLITADGGFDFSTDFDHQEVNMTKLLYGQIVYALCMQKEGGCFVLKVFDIFMQHTVDMIALLASMYRKVYVTKPNTSRSANSERYIVCKGFLHTSSYQFFPILYNSFRKVLSVGTVTSPLPTFFPLKEKTGEDRRHIPKYISCLFPNFALPYLFLSRLEECNVVLGQSQIENIYVTLSFIVGECMPQSRSLISDKGGGLGSGAGSFSRPDAESCPQTLDTTKNEIDLIEFPESARGSVADTPNQRIFYRTKIYNIIKSNIQKCIQWCNQHNIACNY
jgi:23S rRNA U2552 (ribose-2'-O)-methylase RlmE/FtsJ